METSDPNSLRINQVRLEDHLLSLFREKQGFKILTLNECFRTTVGGLETTLRLKWLYRKVCGQFQPYLAKLWRWFWIFLAPLWITLSEKWNNNILTITSWRELGMHEWFYKSPQLPEDHSFNEHLWWKFEQFQIQNFDFHFNFWSLPGNKINKLWRYKNFLILNFVKFTISPPWKMFTDDALQKVGGGNLSQKIGI